MPPKGWKKNAQPQQAAPAPTAKAPTKKASAKPEQLTKSAGSTGQASRTPAAPETITQVSQIVSTLVSARAGLTGAANLDIQVVNALDEGLMNAFDHLDRLRESLPFGKEPPAAELGHGEALQSAPAAPQAAATTAPAPTAPAPIQAAPAQAPAPYGAPPPAPARA